MATCLDCNSDCRYRAKVDYKVYCCNYILIHGEPRGCDCGRNCTKYEKGRQAKVPADFDEIESYEVDEVE